MIQVGDLVRAQLGDDGDLGIGIVVRGGKHGVAVQFIDNSYCWLSPKYLEVLSERR